MSMHSIRKFLLGVSFGATTIFLGRLVSPPKSISGFAGIMRSLGWLHNVRRRRTAQAPTQPKSTAMWPWRGPQSHCEWQRHLPKRFIQGNL